MTINQKIHQRGRFELVELPADVSIKPGHLIERTATGVKLHATAGGFGETLVAFEDSLQARTVLDAYAIGEPVRAGNVLPGSICLFLLLAGSNYTIGTKLISDGAGRLKPTTGSPNKIVGQIEYAAVNLSASGAVDTLGQVRVW